MKKLSDATRISLLRRIVILFFLCGIFLSFNLWTADRIFPLLPVFGNTPLFSNPFDYVLAFGLIAGLCVGFFYWNKWISISTLVILFILLLEDQNRWQAWVYIYLLFLVALSLPRRAEDGIKNILLYLRIIIVGMYTWSGIHKLNPHFIDVTWYNIRTDLLGIADQQLFDKLELFGYVIPLVEITIGVFLLIPKTRNNAVRLAVVTHLFILLYLSPLGINSNTVVYPWNAAMIGIVPVLFYGTTERFDLLRRIKMDYVISFVLVLAWILPALNLAGRWDHYLSFAYYSSKTSQYYIVISEEYTDQIDQRLHAYFLPAQNIQGGKIIDVSQWSLAELNVPLYPERRAFKKVAGMFCAYGIPEEQVYFLELKPPVGKGEVITHTCADE